MIVFDNVSKQYGSRKVLDGVSLNINPQEFVSIIGPSGAGKSTLIHALIGDERINDGSIKVDDFHVHAMSNKALQLYRRNVGIVFQDYKLLRKKNVFENIAFALEACGYSKAHIKERVEDVLHTTGLHEIQAHYPHQLSGGEQQRVAIGRALVHNPKLIVADEPTGNLDHDSAVGILKLLMKINESGTTVLMATHNRHLVDEAQRRVVRLENGKVVSDKAKSGYH